MKIRFPGVIFIVIALLLFFTLPQSFSISQLQASPTSNQSGINAVEHRIDLKNILIGDGRISTQAERGSVWSCRTRLGGDGIGGSQASGAWIHPDGTYDLTAKPTVDGQVYWDSQLTIRLNRTVRSLVGNRLPSSPTGQFPIAPNDDAYRYERNPNSITPANYWDVKQVNLYHYHATWEYPYTVGCYRGTAANLTLK
ncbi:MAG TPA: hypothetical protein DCE56_06130 [Cyanobacteria bacterium UBA8553]|nr:hypothetical protein [Cyanobacteria bacterium UBA8553]